jgi:hypothetical protein
MMPVWFSQTIKINGWSAMKNGSALLVAKKLNEADASIP